MNATLRILSALRRRHAAPDGAWLFATEVRVSTGYLSWDLGAEHRILLGCAEQRIDAFALHTWPSERGRRVAYEVKVSRSDLKRELDNPGKAAAAMHLSHEFYLVVPHDLIVVAGSLPDEWGLMRVDDAGRVRIQKTALYRESPAPPYPFMLSVARNIARTQLARDAM